MKSTAAVNGCEIVSTEAGNLSEAQVSKDI